MHGKAMVWLERVGVLGAVLLVGDLGWALWRGEADALYVVHSLLMLCVFALLWRGARASRAGDLGALTRALLLAAGVSVVGAVLEVFPVGGAPIEIDVVNVLLSFVVTFTPALGLLALAAVLRRVHELMQDEALTV